jgi:hypothetical protein
MSQREFEIAGKKFKLSKLDAFKQFHIVRRLTPLLSELLPALSSLSKNDLKTQSEAKKLENMAKIAGPVMAGFSKLSDADADRVLYGLLSCVEIQQDSGNWAKVSTDTSLMFQDLELSVLLQAAGRALMYNMSGFFSALPQSS